VKPQREAMLTLLCREGEGAPRPYNLCGIEKETVSIQREERMKRLMREGKERVSLKTGPQKKES